MPADRLARLSRVPRLGYSLAVVGLAVKRGLILEVPPRLGVPSRGTQYRAAKNSGAFTNVCYTSVTAIAEKVYGGEPAACGSFAAATSCESGLVSFSLLLS